MNPQERTELARQALLFIASYAGAQETLAGPPIQLWTLRATLSPELVAGSTVAEEMVLAWLTEAPGPAAASGPRYTQLVGRATRYTADDAAIASGEVPASQAMRDAVARHLERRHAERMELMQSTAFPAVIHGPLDKPQTTGEVRCTTLSPEDEAAWLDAGLEAGGAVAVASWPHTAFPDQNTWRGIDLTRARAEQVEAVDARMGPVTKLEALANFAAQCEAKDDPNPARVLSDELLRECADENRAGN